MTQTQKISLLQLWIPRQEACASWGVSVAFSLLIALCAQVAIPLPFTPIPITGQSFAVLFTGFLLGSRWGSLAVGLYLLEGSLGLPFFQGAHGGLLYALGPTGGYLSGFLPAAWLAGTLAERGWDRHPFSAAAAMFLASLPIYALGLLGLLRFMPLERALLLGVFPFLPGDLLKILMAATLLPLGWRLLGGLAGRE
ncbi:MAG: biotin transporter BioY [Elusimicrobia bacterium]|nr:biotin transporter BioY [Elusimicrobiota bacterium]